MKWDEMRRFSYKVFIGFGGHLFGHFTYSHLLYWSMGGNYLMNIAPDDCNEKLKRLK